MALRHVRIAARRRAGRRWRHRLLLLAALAPAPVAAGGLKRVPSPLVDPAAPAETWVERRADRSGCVEGARIRGAEVIDPSRVELRLNRGERVRLRFARACPQLSYYGGFYFASPDSRLCAGRDRLIGREGGACEIEAVVPMAARRSR